MRGIDIARNYYEEYGRKAIREAFPELEEVLAVGLSGSGSECYGFDDKVSRDHDFEPGFCIWIPGEDRVDRRTEFLLERTYSKLPKEYMGLKKSLLKPAGGDRHGVMRISEFLERHIGRKDEHLSLEDWFCIPESALSEVTNGEVWEDGAGEFTRIRQKLGTMPEDVKLKKLAGSLYLMGQSGSYNYVRCIAHGEKGAAQLSLAEFARHAMHAAFLVNDRYMPYYKWSFRALSLLPVLPELGGKLEELLNTGNSPEEVEKKKKTVEECTRMVLDAVRREGLCEEGADPGKHAEALNSRIRDPYIRNADLLAGVSEIR